MYSERRSHQAKFYDGSGIRIGKQALGNRLRDLFTEINTSITFTETDCMIRTVLKRAFFAENNKPIPRVPTVVCFNGPGLNCQNVNCIVLFSLFSLSRHYNKTQK